MCCKKINLLLLTYLIYFLFFVLVNLFIKKAFMKSRDHFGTPMPLYLSAMELKVKISKIN